MNTKLISAALGAVVLVSPFLGWGNDAGNISQVSAAGCNNFSDNFDGGFQNTYSTFYGIAPSSVSNRLRTAANNLSIANTESYASSVSTLTGDMTATAYMANMPIVGGSETKVYAIMGLVSSGYTHEFNIEFVRVSGGQATLRFKSVTGTPQVQSLNISDRSNIYLRIVRSGSVMKAYYSTDGTNYIVIGQRSTTHTGPLSIGFGHYLDTTSLANLSSYSDFDNASVVCQAIEPGQTPVATTAPIYRFLNKRKTSHFYTMDKAERDNLIANNSANWKYEGVAFNASTGPATGFAAVYRFYSAAYNSHFYTMDAGEKNTLIATNKNWSYQGIAYYAKTTVGAGFAPVYRFYGASYKSHFWTKDVNEKNAIVAGNPNWKYEGVGYYAK